MDYPGESSASHKGFYKWKRQQKGENQQDGSLKTQPSVALDLKMDRGSEQRNAGSR